MNTLLLILKYLPLVLEIVTAIERTLGGLSGAQKKAMVMDIIPSGPNVPEKDREIVSGLVDKVVEMLNVNGIFKKS